MQAEANRTPEQEARQTIDAQLSAASWAVQDAANLNLSAAQGVAVRELQSQGGPADYILFVDGKALGVVETKKEGSTLSSVAEQSARYSHAKKWIPQGWADPLPCTYETTGVETNFRDQRDPDARSREVFALHTIRRIANEAVHTGHADQSQALHGIKLIRGVAIWFHKLSKPDFKAGAFIPPPPPADASDELQKELEELRAKLGKAQQARNEAENNASSLAEANAQAERGSEQAYQDQLAALELAAESEKKCLSSTAATTGKAGSSSAQRARLSGFPSLKWPSCSTPSSRTFHCTSKTCSRTRS